MHETRLTSQGTITLPVSLRRKYNLRAGELLVVSDEHGITISKPVSLTDLRARNKVRLQEYTPHTHTYRAGDGFTAHSIEKYGKK